MSRPYTVIRFPKAIGGEEAVVDPTALPTDFVPVIGPLTVGEEHLSAADAKKAAEEGAVIVPRGLPVSLVEPLEEASVAAVPTTAWGLEAIGATKSSRTGAGVTVAVLDTGCHVEHPAFTRLRTNGLILKRNFTTVGGPDDVTDTNGHGTHCAGSICGEAVDGQRIGVAPGISRLLVGKVLGQGGGTTETILQALGWAVDHGAQIVSMSLGIDFPGWVDRIVAQTGLGVRPATSRALHDYRLTVASYAKLVDYMADRGVLVVAATGNESNRPGFTIDVSPPAAADPILRVGAVGRVGAALGVAEFSNTGPDVVAPGVGILSAQAGGGLKTLSGTSMATPHVAGAAALWREHLLATAGTVTHTTLKARLLATAGPVPGVSFEDVGNGLVTCPP